MTAVWQWCIDVASLALLYPSVRSNAYVFVNETKCLSNGSEWNNACRIIYCDHDTATIGSHVNPLISSGQSTGHLGPWFQTRAVRLPATMCISFEALSSRELSIYVK